MIGEMRDEETARIAVEASLTGHLVMSTLHTNSAAESVTRLLEIGIDPFTFADSLLGVMAQRLVRRLCTNCRRPEPMSDDSLQGLARDYLGGGVSADEGSDTLVARCAASTVTSTAACTPGAGKAVTNATVRATAAASACTNC